jgi:hypothetical protein
MTTYGDMQNRIADELGGRADLAAQVQLAIQTAIAKWERERFYFNELRAANAFSTAQGQEFYGASDYAPLATIAHLDKVTVLVSGNRYTLAPRLAQYLEDVSVNPLVRGQPIDYAYYAEQLRLYPIPDNAYPVSLLGTTRFAALANPGDSNPWMLDAEALIRCEAKMDVYENTLQQSDLADRMRLLIHGDPSKPGHRGYLYALKAETARRAAVGRTRPSYF